MNKVCDDIYEHRGHVVIKDEQGIWVENHLELFPTWRDAQYFIDKIIDGTQAREPKVIGTWQDPKEKAGKVKPAKSKRDDVER